MKRCLLIAAVCALVLAACSQQKITTERGPDVLPLLDQSFLLLQ